VKNRDLFKRHASAERIDQALQQLASRGLVSRQQLWGEGPPTNLWSATEEA
jgi:DNA-binding HxlR family transcriptional regulator